MLRIHANNLPTLRLVGLILLILLCLVVEGIWVKELANSKARSVHLSSAREHYAVVLAELDRRWGQEAFNLKTRIESQNILDDPKGRNEQLQTFLISQGSSIEFPSLRIEKTTGEVIAAYDYTNHANPKVTLLPGQLSTWVRSAADGNLYFVIRQFIWLGKENGYLLLFKPLDHSLLTQTTYPGTRLSLWWKGDATASSDGEDGLRSLATRLQKPEISKTSLVLMWPGPVSDNTPKLLVEILSDELLETGDIVKPMVFLLLLIVTLAIGFSALNLEIAGRAKETTEDD
ncbi:MAG: hypothetical protein H6R18_1680 [Proteobacteria bacterium]|nr:hypothetical protein [Pseudomonadota bacterium]